MGCSGTSETPPGQTRAAAEGLSGAGMGCTETKNQGGCLHPSLSTENSLSVTIPQPRALEGLLPYSVAPSTPPHQAQPTKGEWQMG